MGLEGVRVSMVKGLLGAWRPRISARLARPRCGSPLHHTHGDLTSLAPHERLSELPVVPREKSDTGAAAGENPRDAPVLTR